MLAALLLGAAVPGVADAFTVFSTDQSLNNSGIFYGPGKLPDSKIFNVLIRNVVFLGDRTFVTPFVNNGAEGPLSTGEREIEKAPNGMLSDGITPVNENADTGPFELNGIPFLAVIAGGGKHGGEQISVMHDGNMIMTMDIGFDMGIGEGGVVTFPFYGTTGEVTVPYSLQTQLGLAGGTDRAGSLKSGDKIHGWLGNAAQDGFLSGSLVVAGNMPMSSIFMPGAPYALTRNFQTDMPVDGQRVGRLPGSQEQREAERARADLRFPEDAARFRPIVAAEGN
jgi:hypothetical protein